MLLFYSLIPISMIYIFTTTYSRVTKLSNNNKAVPKSKQNTQTKNKGKTKGKMCWKQSKLLQFQKKKNKLKYILYEVVFKGKIKPK